MGEPMWQGLLPEPVAVDLLSRWAEPHRHYHSTQHLIDGLAALDALGGERLEQIAFWFHDAVHTNTTPADEEASALIAREALSGWLPSDEVDEVARLVLLTAHHRPEPGDLSGARVSDADLSSLGADWETYRRNAEGIRRELPHITDEQWRLGRSAFLSGFLQRERFYVTPLARDLWEDQARRNLARELSSYAS
ncbi:HD domain-containing protein [Tessaracoccus caeni]|uniref:HD domain-containing protein n=1 Tax=Tessaracoccus caeni TaxID=3031239 RepID=UPI0023DB0AFF|nr:hypothetical protein [Tessaracoccus caeni]MDF1490233.1 hypothetical protein [Tessaracoccus caeni]